jgi:hypothetical protein
MGKPSKLFLEGLGLWGGRTTPKGQGSGGRFPNTSWPLGVVQLPFQPPQTGQGGGWLSHDSSSFLFFFKFYYFSLIFNNFLFFI